MKILSTVLFMYFAQSLGQMDWHLLQASLEGQWQLIFTLHGDFIYCVVCVFLSKLRSNRLLTAGLSVHIAKNVKCVHLQLAKVRKCMLSHSRVWHCRRLAHLLLYIMSLEISADSETCYLIAYWLLSITTHSDWNGRSEQAIHFGFFSR